MISSLTRPFYLSLFVSPIRNRSVQIYTPAARWSDVGNFRCLSTLLNHHRHRHHLSSSLFQPFVPLVLVDNDHPEAIRLCHLGGDESACPPIVLSDCYRAASNPVPLKILNWFVPCVLAHNFPVYLSDTLLSLEVFLC